MNHDETRPADGSVFGWLDNGTVTALIIYYTEGWSLCPHAGVPEDRWPLYTDDGQFGMLVRERLGTEGVVDLAPLIGDTRGLVFWVPAGAEAGSGIIAVKADLPPEPDGYVLPAGRYVHYKTLRSGAALPSLGDLLADRQRVDLGLRFAVTPAGGGR